jgi:hypothetical protein
MHSPLRRPGRAAIPDANGPGRCANTAVPGPGQEVSPDLNSTVAVAPRWAVPHPTPERRLDQIRAQYPDALAWYGEKSGLWLAAPTGAAGLIQARTPAGLAHQLEQHYKQFLAVPRRPQTSRPVHPQRPQRRGSGGTPISRPSLPEQHWPGGAGAVARATFPHPVASRVTAPRGSAVPPAPPRTRHRRFRRGMSRLGLMAGDT